MKTKYAAILNLVEEEEKLQPLTRRRPVATLPFACRYRLIDFPFSRLFNAQIPSAALFISGSGRSLYDHIRAGTSWGLDNMAGGGVFTHSQIKLKAESDEIDGYNNYYYQDHFDYINKTGAKYVVLQGAAILSNIPIDAVLNHHIEKQGDITVAYKKVPRNELSKDTNYSSYNFIDKKDEEIKEMIPLSELPYDDSPISFGLNFLIAEVDVFLEYLEKLREKRQLVSVDNILQLALAGEETCVNGFEYTGYLKAIENMKDYFEANMDMLDEELFNSLFYRETPILTKSKNSAPTYYGISCKVKNAQFANDCEVYGTVEDSLIFRRNFICQNAVIKNSILLRDCFIDEDVELNYVIIDKHVHIEKGVKLKGTPENPLVISKGARVLSSGEIVEG